MSEAARRELVETLQREGIRDGRVLHAMGRVPREQFVPPEHHGRAYQNIPLPIGGGQTISQPYVVALMLQALGLRGGERVLEVGTGSGYQTALLAELAAEVLSLERSTELAQRAAQVLAELDYRGVQVHVADGSLGWPAAAPYQGIIVSAGAPYVPDALSHQLDDGGRLIIPVGPGEAQELVLLERQGMRLQRKVLGPVRFVPLVGAAAWGTPFTNGTGSPR